MGADPIRPRAARHAVMAAYYQIAGAAERSVSPSLVGGALAAMARGRAPQAHRGNANSIKCKPSSEPKRPSSSLGGALAIFSVPGPTSPRPPGGAFFNPDRLRVAELTSAPISIPYSIKLLRRLGGVHGAGINLRVAHLRHAAGVSLHRLIGRRVEQIDLTHNAWHLVTSSRAASGVRGANAMSVGNEPRHRRKASQLKLRLLRARDSGADHSALRGE